MDKKINPNLAGTDELAELPGIGAKLAERIIENRPFFSIDDLLRVKGIGPSNLAQWLDVLTLEPDPDTAEIPVLDLQDQQVDLLVAKQQENEDEDLVLPEEAQDAADETTFTSPVVFEMPVEESEAKTIPLPIEPVTVSKETFSREQVLLIAGGGSFMAFILAVALILGLLAGINQGRLRFASPTEVNALSVSVDSLTNRITIQESDLQSLRSRVDTLETLSDRMTTAEENINTLIDDLNALTTEVDGLNEDVAALNNDVDELQTQTTLFTTFIEGLRDVFNQFFPTQGGGNE